MYCKKTRRTVQEFYDHYVSYCTKMQLKTKGKIEFNNALGDIGIKYKPSNSQNVYKVTYDELKQISDKFHWVHKLDEYKSKENDDEDYDSGIDKSEKAVDVKLLRKLDMLEEKVEMIEDVLADAVSYIKRLEAYVKHAEETYMIHSKYKAQTTNEEDFVQISDNMFLNKKTGKKVEVADESQMEDDEPLF